MPMTNKLLQNVFFGTELEKLHVGTYDTVDGIFDLVGTGAVGEGEGHKQLVELASNFFEQRYPGRFGGTITPGDAVFIAAFMVSVRPEEVIEIGVCSGLSSAFILVSADRFGLGLPDQVFLSSIDAVEEFGDPSRPIGAVVEKNFSHWMSSWALRTKTTSLDMQNVAHFAENSEFKKKSVLCFVDADHRHPWPLVDVCMLRKHVPHGTWILLQDIQVTERWLGNSIERGVICPTPERGVNIVFSHWPGGKIMGTEMCYNMAAIKMDVADGEFLNFVEMCLSYRDEMPPEDAAVLRNLLSCLK